MQTGAYHMGEVYVAIAVVEGRGRVAIDRPEDLADPGIKALGVVYADRHGERVINRRPVSA